MPAEKQEKRTKVALGGMIAVIVCAVACAFGLFYLTDLPPVALLKTTKYVLTGEMGMGFYDAPGGREQNVMYLEEGADASQLPEPKEGERWLHDAEMEVEAPEDGWAKVDIGDGGAPLYVEAQYVASEEVPLFEGRDGEGTFLSVGAKNLPPSGWMWLMGLLVYFFLLYPWYMLFGNMKLNDEEFKAKVGQRSALLVYAGLGYFALFMLLTKVCGYNLSMHWFVSDSYMGSLLLVILNVILGLAGSLGVFIILYRFLLDRVNMLSSPADAFRSLGWKGVSLLTFGIYFILIFTGVFVAVVVVCVGIWAFLTLLPKALAGVAGAMDGKKADIPPHKCCASCTRFDGHAHCYEGGEVHDPMYQCCGNYQPHGLCGS